jgi:hypothetical protein
MERIVDTGPNFQFCHTKTKAKQRQNEGRSIRSRLEEDKMPDVETPTIRSYLSGYRCPTKAAGDGKIKLAEH